MSEQSKRMLRGSARAATGLVVIGVSVGVAVVLGTGVLAVPGVERGIVSVEVDTSQNATSSLVCAGAFGELGADPKRPTVAVPGGSTQVVVTGEGTTERELEREQPVGSAPLVVDSSARESVAAAERQLVATPTLQGLAASSCAEPAHEQWLVGGATGLGQSATLVIGNPYDVPATVQVTLFDGEGQIDASSSAGVLVPAGSQRIVSINGYAPGRDELVARVDSTGAAVTAALSVSQTVDIRSYAVDTVTRQLVPQTRLVVPGIVNISNHTHSEVGSVAGVDDFPVVVRVLAPGDVSGTAEITALLPDGAAESLGTLEIEHGTVAEFEVSKWPEDAQAVVVDADVPVVGGVFSTVDVAPAHDYYWSAPAPELPAGADVALSVVDSGRLVLANPGDADATVTIVPADEQGEERTVEVPAGTAVEVAAQGRNRLRTTAPVSASVRIVEGAYVASYPVFAPADEATSLTVFPR